MSAGEMVTPLQRRFLSPLRMKQNSTKPTRHLEIGPGVRRIPGFETLNVVGGYQVDYIGDATKSLNFPDDTFNTIYASHIAEHVPWYAVEGVLKRWVRSLKPGGNLEIWVPDGLKIAKAFVEAETKGGEFYKDDDWWMFNEHHDPCLWANGRMFSYGDGSDSNIAHYNWHHSLYSERYLREVMARLGLDSVRLLDRSEVRGHDHGWINLGVTGKKSEM
jgi:predicted SAM-dependent methyltransferase